MCFIVNVFAHVNERQLSSQMSSHFCIRVRYSTAVFSEHIKVTVLIVQNSLVAQDQRGGTLIHTNMQIAQVANIKADVSKFLARSR